MSSNSPKETYAIAVVGGGVAAVAFVNSFVDQIVSHNTRKIMLTLFEKGAVIGSGYAYQEDPDCLRLNSPPHSQKSDAYQVPCARRAQGLVAYI